MSIENKNTLIQSFPAPGVDVPENPPTYNASVFPEISRQIITMMCSLLGYDNNHVVDETILGFRLTLCPNNGPLIRLDYSRYLIVSINLHLIQFSITGYFRFQSDLVYLFLYFQVKCASLNLNLQDVVGNPSSIIH